METIERITAQVYTSGPASVTTPCRFVALLLRRGYKRETHGSAERSFNR